MEIEGDLERERERERKREREREREIDRERERGFQISRSEEEEIFFPARKIIFFCFSTLPSSCFEHQEVFQ
jgi:hypothetical protein